MAWRALFSYAVHLPSKHCSVQQRSFSGPAFSHFSSLGPMPVPLYRKICAKKCTKCSLARRQLFPFYTLMMVPGRQTAMTLRQSLALVASHSRTFLSTCARAYSGTLVHRIPALASRNRTTPSGPTLSQHWRPPPDGVLRHRQQLGGGSSSSEGGARWSSSRAEEDESAEADALRQRNSAVMYISSVLVLFVGLSYAAVPLYRMFCQQMGWGGKAEQAAGHKTDKVSTMARKPQREITVHFNADTASSMKWRFKPIQESITVVPGETALAFYTARNPLAKPVTGIATYNIVPIDAGAYFNKIQCFCFEEQRLDPDEEVDMPVFFYLDPDLVEDPRLENIHDIWLSYHFFEAKPGMSLPLPDEFRSSHLKQ